MRLLRGRRVVYKTYIYGVLISPLVHKKASFSKKALDTVFWTGEFKSGHQVYSPSNPVQLQHVTPTYFHRRTMIPLNPGT